MYESVKYFRNKLYSVDFLIGTGSCNLKASIVPRDKGVLKVKSIKDLGKKNFNEYHIGKLLCKR